MIIRCQYFGNNTSRLFELCTFFQVRLCLFELSRLLQIALLHYSGYICVIRKIFHLFETYEDEIETKNDE